MENILHYYEKCFALSAHYVQMISQRTMALVNRLTEEGRGKPYSQERLRQMRETDVRATFRGDTQWLDSSRLPIEPWVQRSVFIFWPFDDTFKFDLKCYLGKRPGE